MESTLVYTITAIDDKMVKYDMQSVMTIMGNEFKTNTPMKLSLKMEKRGEKSKKPKTRRDTIRVKAGKFRCIRTDDKIGVNTTKVWISNRVPGGLVKLEMKGTASTTMELVEFKGK